VKDRLQQLKGASDVLTAARKAVALAHEQVLFAIQVLQEAASDPVVFLSALSSASSDDTTGFFLDVETFSLLATVLGWHSKFNLGNLTAEGKVSVNEVFELFRCKFPDLFPSSSPLLDDAPPLPDIAREEDRTVDTLASGFTEGIGAAGGTEGVVVLETPGATLSDKSD
jgi:hypothetical protein